MGDEMTAGVFIGFVLGWWMSAYAHVLWKRVLIDKAHSTFPTAEKIGAEFYYIVREEDYVRMCLPALSAKP